MTVTLEPLKGFVVGSYGQPYILTVINDSGVAQDVSGYTTSITVIAMPPSKKAAVTDTAAYTTDGTDGKITGAGFAEGEIDEPGNWELQIEFFKAGELFKTYPAIMEVGEGLR